MICVSTHTLALRGVGDYGWLEVADCHPAAALGCVLVHAAAGCCARAYGWLRAVCPDAWLCCIAGC